MNSNFSNLLRVFLASIFLGSIVIAASANAYYKPDPPMRPFLKGVGKVYKNYNKRKTEAIKQDPKSSAQGQKLGQDLFKREHRGIRFKPIAGAGTKRTIDDINRISKEFHVNPMDVSKVTGSHHNFPGGGRGQIHSYVDQKSGRILESKVKMGTSKK